MHIITHNILLYRICFTDILGVTKTKQHKDIAPKTIPGIKNGGVNRPEKPLASYVTPSNNFKK
jgi:hypothetical protein